VKVTRDPPTGVRWESARLAEPLVLRRPWRAPWLERPDGTALPTDGSGARLADGADGEPVRVAPVFSFLQVGWMLQVDGRPVPVTAPVSRSAGLGVFAGTFAMFVLSGLIGAASWYAVCFLVIAVRRCEGDPSTRRSQARTVALAGAATGLVVIALGALLTAALRLQTPVLVGMLAAH
jgi:putative Ca2+/H+ antiporter (TMEM165/GDT1 family)